MSMFCLSNNNNAIGNNNGDGCTSQFMNMQNSGNRNMMFMNSNMNVKNDNQGNSMFNNNNSNNKSNTNNLYNNNSIGNIISFAGKNNSGNNNQNKTDINFNNNNNNNSGNSNQSKTTFNSNNNNYGNNNQNKTAFNSNDNRKDVNQSNNNRFTNTDTNNYNRKTNQTAWGVLKNNLYSSHHLYDTTTILGSDTFGVDISIPNCNSISLRHLLIDLKYNKIFISDISPCDYAVAINENPIQKNYPIEIQNGFKIALASLKRPTYPTFDFEINNSYFQNNQQQNPISQKMMEEEPIQQIPSRTSEKYTIDLQPFNQNENW